MLLGSPVGGALPVALQQASVVSLTSLRRCCRRALGSGSTVPGRHFVPLWLQGDAAAEVGPVVARWGKQFGAAGQAGGGGMGYTAMHWRSSGNSGEGSMTMHERVTRSRGTVGGLRFVLCLAAVAVGSAAVAARADVSQQAVVTWGSGIQSSVPVAALANVVAVLGNNYGQLLALRADGTVVAWSYGLAPCAGADLSGVVDAVEIALGGGHCLMRHADGTVTGLGADDGGRISGMTSLSNVVQIAASDRYSLALLADGTVVGAGELPAPVPSDLADVVAVAAAQFHSLALKRDGTVVGWGRPSSVGYGATTPPAGLSDVVAISAAQHASLALRADGTAVGWGLSAAPPADLPPLVALATGNSAFAIGLKADGTIAAWGSNPATSIPDIAAGGVVAIGVQEGIPSIPLAIVTDATPPALSLPADLSVAADAASGATVTFDAVATDAIAGAVAPLCDPASGSLFPVGTTTVTCHASDPAGNSSAGSFDVTVTTTPCGAVDTAFCATAGGAGAIHCAAGARCVGTSGADVICGSPGDDRIYGMGGDDVICAGAGNDRIKTGDGNDRIDTVSACGQSVPDVGSTADEKNRVDAKGGDDLALGGGGADTLVMGGGNDVALGGAEADRMFGGTGDDCLVTAPDTRSLATGNYGDDICCADRQRRCEQTACGGF